MDKIKRFEGRVAIITGGGSGIGCATALRFAEEGAMVAVADINSSNGQETCRQIKAAGGRGLFVRAADRETTLRCSGRSPSRLLVSKTLYGIKK